MKKIILYFFMLTTYSFSNNYNDMFNELEGITSIIVIDSEDKKIIEGAKIKINDINDFTNAQGIVEYNPSNDELLEEEITIITVQKKGYLAYQGKFRVGTEEKKVYLEKEAIIPKEVVEKSQKVAEITALKKEKNLISKVRVVALEDGVLYQEGKKLRAIKSGIESFFRMREGVITLNLDTPKVIYRKSVNIVSPETLVVFTKGDIIKVKEISKVNPTAPKKPIAPKPSVVEKEKVLTPIKPVVEKTPKNITNEYLIEEIVKPLKDGSVFNVTTDVSYYEMKEDEDRGAFADYKYSDGREGRMNQSLFESIRRKMRNGEFLDNYYYVMTSLKIEIKDDYLKKAEKIISQIAIQEQENVSINTNWNSESDGMYFAFPSAKKVEDGKLIDKVYRISYKNTDKYSKFFESLKGAIKAENRYQINLLDESSYVFAFNTSLRGNSYYYSIQTDIGSDEISKKLYSQNESYFERKYYNLFKTLYTDNNKFYFVSGSNSELKVDFLRKNDGRKLLKSRHKKVM